MHDYESYAAVIITALTVLVLGCLNMKFLQARTSTGALRGYPNYLWVALIALAVGGLMVALRNV